VAVLASHAARFAPPAVKASPALLGLYVNGGSSAIRAQDEAVLDHKARLFNEGGRS
jgi:hypothetical protein